MGKQAACERCGKKFLAIVPDSARNIICFECARVMEQVKRLQEEKETAHE
jgi:hypothetical protein